MLVLLVGPKGSGKTHIGRILEKHFGIHFFEAEKHWIEFTGKYPNCDKQAFLSDGISFVNSRLLESIGHHQKVSIETTGASQEILDSLLSHMDPNNDVIIRIRAPLDLCLKRIKSRSQTHHLKVDDSVVRAAYELSTTLDLDSNIQIENVDADEATLVQLLSTVFPQSA